MNRIAHLLVLALLLAACGTQPSELPQRALPTATAALEPRATALPKPTAAAEPTSTTSAPAPTRPRAYAIGDTGQIQAWDPLTGEVMQIAQVPSNDATLSPDANLVAFVAEGRFFMRDLRTSVTTDITPVELTEQDLSMITGFHWSPDSRTLLFDLAVLSADPPQPTIYRAEPGVAQPASALIEGVGPAWSPTGDYIAYAGAPFEGASLYGGGPGGVLTVAAANGANPRTLGDPTRLFPLYQPVLWSHTGERIAAADTLVNVSNGAVVARVPEVDGDVLGAITRLAPDGRSFGLWRSVRASTPNQDDPYLFDEFDEFVWVTEDGTPQLVASGQRQTCPCMPLAPTAWVSWDLAGKQALVAGYLEGSEQKQLRLQQGDNVLRMFDGELAFEELPGDPFWSPDGRYVLLNSYQQSNVLWALPLDGSEPVALGDLQPLGWRP